MLRERFGEDRVRKLGAPFSASEDFGSFGAEWDAPSVFWFVVRPLRRRVTDDQVALYLEEHEPTLEATVLSAVEGLQVATPVFSPYVIPMIVPRTMTGNGTSNARIIAGPR